MRRSLDHEKQPEHGVAVREIIYSGPCSICRAVVPSETLMNRGAMCQGCYDDYIQGAKQNRIGLDSRKGRV